MGSGPAAYTQVPYASAFTGFGGPAAPPLTSASPQRFPAGAVWLIGLGVLFLLGNIMPAWRITGRWFVPILLAGISVWIGARRIAALNGAGALGTSAIRPSLPGALLAPSILFTLALLLALQDAYWVPFKHSWPALLIVWGALLLLDRTQPPLVAAAGTDSSTPLGRTVPPSSR
jgi:hypothetical protein